MVGFFSDFTPAPGGSGSTPKPNAPRAGTPPVPKSVQKLQQLHPQLLLLHRL